MRNFALSTLLISLAGVGCSETESGTSATTSSLRNGAGRIGDSKRIGAANATLWTRATGRMEEAKTGSESSV